MAISSISSLVMAALLTMQPPISGSPASCRPLHGVAVKGIPLEEVREADLEEHYGLPERGNPGPINGSEYVERLNPRNTDALSMRSTFARKDLGDLSLAGRVYEIEYFFPKGREQAQVLFNTLADKYGPPCMTRGSLGGASIDEFWAAFGAGKEAISFLYNPASDLTLISVRNEDISKQLYTSAATIAAEAAKKRQADPRNSGNPF